MKFPSLVYRCPGTHQCPGGTFDYLAVRDQAALDAAVKDGWHPALPDAIAEKYGEKLAGRLAPLVDHLVPPGALPADSGEAEVLGEDPPTRAELEQKARELGVRFTKKTADEDLSKAISEALGA